MKLTYLEPFGSQDPPKSMGGPQTRVSNKQISVYIADCVVDAYDLELKVPKVAPKTIID